MTEVSQWHEPSVDETELLVVESGGDTTARSVTANNNVLDLEVLDSVLNNGQGVQVSCIEDVGNVTVAENITGLEACR